MNILTIDLEDWFHILDSPVNSGVSYWNKMESRVERNTDRILELLENKNIKATWFCLGWIAEKYPALIKKISCRHEIAAHSMYHQLLYEQNKASVSEDIHRNISALQNITGKKVNAYRAPGFSFNEKTKWLIEILSEQGIEADCSVFNVKRNHGGYPSFPFAKPCRILYNGISMKELPLNKVNISGKQLVFSGGGYFRAFPYWFIKHSMKRSDYVMTYFHPRDFDPGQPLLENLPLKRKLMSYTGLKNSFWKFGQMVNDFKFVSVEDAVKSINWNETPEVNLSNI